MAADYDAPRATDDDGALDTIVLQRATRQAPADIEDAEMASQGVGWDDLESEVVVIPLQATEFVCTGCFLMVSRLQLSPDHSHGALCLDCAA
jgi:hypothetical protein